MPVLSPNTLRWSAHHERLARLWGTEAAHLDSVVTNPPWVITVDPSHGAAFGFVPAGSMAVLVADVESALLRDLALAAAHRDEPLLRQCTHTVVARVATAPAGEATAARVTGSVDVDYCGRTVATVVVDAALGFSLVQLPYHGGVLDPAAFTARTRSRRPATLETVILVREPSLTPLERLVNDLTAAPLEGIWFGGVIYNFVKEAAHHAEHDVEHAAKDVAHAAQVAAPAVEHAAQAAGPVVDAVGEGALDAVGEGYRMSYVEPAVRSSAPALGAEPDIAELVKYRNSVLSTHRG